MIRNYFIAACRNFWRNKTFSTINVLGLSIGIGASLVIFLIIHHEFSYDNFQKDKDRIFRVVLDAKFNGTEGHSSAVPAPLSGAIQNEVTGVDQTVPVMQFQGDGTAKVIVLRENSKEVIFKKQPEIVFTNNEYFQLTPHQWLAGSAANSLKEPFSVVLSESRAQQYFPDTEPADIIGKQIRYNDEMLTTTVTGIIKDLNQQTIFTAVEFISFTTIAKTRLQQQFMMEVWNDWMAYSHVFVKISKGSTAERIEAQLQDVVKKYNKDANKDANNTFGFHLQPLGDIHFNNLYTGFGQRLAHMPTLYGLLAVAIFLLLLGCINFINLTTANAAQRAKEIGVRKTIGGSRKQLIFQFLGETLLLTIIATLLSVALTPILLKMFESFIPPGLKLNLIQQPVLILFLFLITVLVSFLAGVYPALILSKYKPVQVLKNQAYIGSSQTRRLWIRKTLTISQFVIAQFFIIATVGVSKQISYSLRKDMGFKSEAVLTFYQPRDSVKTHGVQLLNAIKNIPGVSIASRGFFSPADEGVAFGNLEFLDGEKMVKPDKNIQVRWGDEDYIKLYQIQLVAGRNIMPSDTLKEFLVNESFARAMGFKNPGDIVNKSVKWNSKIRPVVGVMKDFHDQSMRAEISPIVFGGQNGMIFHVKLGPNNADGSLWRNAIAQMQSLFKGLYPEEDFNYKFLDDTIASFYTNEQNTASLLKWATGLTILISCLGLLGLVIYTTNTRTKEIGVRKILGASVMNIVKILSKDFVMLVLLSFLIACPLAWWAINNWLQDFSFRFNMSVWMFVWCGLAMLAVAIITLSVQVLRAAISNPEKSLRSE